jgi:guanylate kinase
MFILDDTPETQQAIHTLLAPRLTLGRPPLLIFSGPSGVGKGTLLEALKTGKSTYAAGYEGEPWKRFATTVSVTTREPRSSEASGIDYHFVDVEAFEKAIAAGDFLEYKRSGSGDWYGTLNQEVQRISEMGKLPVLEIETEGKKEIERVALGFNVISVFVLPPVADSLNLAHYPELVDLIPHITRYPEGLRGRIITLYQRLATRNSEPLSLRAKRLEKAVIELNEADDYTFQITNDTVGQCVPRLKAIFEAVVDKRVNQIH